MEQSPTRCSQSQCPHCTRDWRYASCAILQESQSTDDILFFPSYTNCIGKNFPVGIPANMVVICHLSSCLINSTLFEPSVVMVQLKKGIYLIAVQSQFRTISSGTLGMINLQRDVKEKKQEAKPRIAKAVCTRMGKKIQQLPHLS